MAETFELQNHIEQGVEKIVTDTIKATLKNPKESAFMMRFAAASRKASNIRQKLENEGLHVPGFLIASITSACNLHCAGCYSRFNHATTDEAPAAQLSSEEWARIFREAEELGISFIMLAGGEPMIRRAVIEEAGKIPDIIFPVFTNGTYVDDEYFQLMDKCRNLVPVLSIEGGSQKQIAAPKEKLVSVELEPLIQSADKVPVKQDPQQPGQYRPPDSDEWERRREAAMKRLNDRHTERIDSNDSRKMQGNSPDLVEHTG